MYDIETSRAAHLPVLHRNCSPQGSSDQDSPVVERALNRSKIYLLFSWSLLYPEDEEFWITCGAVSSSKMDGPCGWSASRA